MDRSKLRGREGHCACTLREAKPNEGFAILNYSGEKSSRAIPIASQSASTVRRISFQSRHFMIRDPRFAQAMGVTDVARAAFPANEKTDVNSFVIVPVALNNPSGGPEANQYSFDLVYDTTTSEQQTGSKDVILAKTNPADTKYSVVENCKELAFK